jgi:hypothetical protein
MHLPTCQIVEASQSKGDAKTITEFPLKKFNCASMAFDGITENERAGISLQAAVILNPATAASIEGRCITTRPLMQSSTDGVHPYLLRNKSRLCSERRRDP